MTLMNKTHALKDNLTVVQSRKIRAALAEQHPQIERILDRIDDIINKPITVAVMGEFSAGKSSFLNRLLGIKALPVSVLPKTATLTRLVHGTEPVVEIEYCFDGVPKIQKHSGYDAFNELQRAAKINNPLFQQELERIREIRVFVNNPILTKFYLLDTPGFNHDEAMDERSLGALTNADLVIWIADYNQLGKKTEFDKLKLIKERIPQLYLIVNKGDAHLSGTEAHQNALEELASSLAENGFLKFFQSEEIYLISSLATEPFWDGVFQQFLARFSEAVLNADLQISLSLIEDQALLLKQLLADESIRYKQLQERIEAFEAENNLDFIVDRDSKALNAHIEHSTLSLRDSLDRHYQKCANLNTDEIFSANMFAAEYLMQELYDRFTVLQYDYATYFNAWEHRYIMNLLVALEQIVGFLPPYYCSLKDRIDKLISYYKLDDVLIINSSQHYLPATGQTIKILDQMGIRQFNSKTAITRLNLKLTLLVLQDGILNINQSLPKMPFGRYVELNIKNSILEDYKADISHITSNRIVNSIFAELNVLCVDANKKICDALNIITE